MKIEVAVFWADEKQGIKIAWPYEKNYNCILFIFVLLEFKGRGFMGELIIKLTEL